MVFSEKGSQNDTEKEHEDIVTNLLMDDNKNQANDPRFSIFSMSKASTVDTNGRSNNMEESDFCFRSNSTVFKNYDPKDNRSNTVQNKIVDPFTDIIISPRKSPPEEIDGCIKMVDEILLKPQKPVIHKNLINGGIIQHNYLHLQEELRVVEEQRLDDELMSHSSLEDL